MPVTFEDHLDRLYGLPPSEFVAVRNEIASELEDDGKGDESTAIKALKKPTMSVWATNRLVRDAAREMGEFLDASAAVEAGLEAGDAEGASTASERRKRALAALRKAAAAILTDAGAGANHLEKVVRNLQFALGHPETREQLAAGRLTKDVEPAGLESAFGVVGPEAAARKGEEKRTAARRKELESELAAAEATLEAARKEAQAAERAAAGARKRLETAERKSSSIQRRLDSLEG